ADLEGPVLGVAGERDGLPGEDLDLLPEAPAARRGLELEPPDVYARSGVPASLGARARPLLAAVHCPGNPGPQAGRNVCGGERLGLGGGEDDEQRRHEGETHAWTPPAG